MDRTTHPVRKHSSVAVLLVLVIGTLLLRLEFEPAATAGTGPTAHSPQSIHEALHSTWQSYRWLGCGLYALLLIKVLVLRENVTELVLCASGLCEFFLSHLIAVNRLFQVELKRLARELRLQARSPSAGPSIEPNTDGHLPEATAESSPPSGEERC